MSSFPSARPHRSAAAFFAALALLLTACGGDSNPATKEPFDVPEGCNPIAADWHCTLPYPSDYFLVNDSDTASGKRVEFSEAARIKRMSGDAVDLFPIHPADGYSPGTQILAFFPHRLSGEQFDGFEAADAGTKVEGATLLLDAESGELVPHIAELDTRPKNPLKRALVLRPLVRLQNAHRYIVAIHGVVDEDGDAVPAASGFALLRDGDAEGKPGIGDLVSHYEDDIFPALKDAGVARDASLQLAWDFTVRTAEDATRDLERIRAAVLATYEDEPPTVKITKTEEFETGALFRRVSGTIDVPLFVDSEEPGARLLRDGDGNVKSDGTAKVPFVAIVPRSVADAGVDDPPARLVQYGHGIFGSRAEVSEDGSWIIQFADTYKLVIMAVDWWGMSEADVGDLLGTLGNDPSKTMAFTDRVHQGMANQLALGEAAMRVMPSLEAFTVNDASAYDASTLYFHGNSLGHIFGATYTGLSPHVSRAALGVGAADFTHFMARSNAFGQFFLVLDAMFENPVDVQFFLAAAQNSFDRVDPLNYAPSVYDPYDGEVERHFLLQMGVGDATVPNIGTAYHARLLGVPVLKGSVVVPPLLEEADAPQDSALAVYALEGDYEYVVSDPSPPAANEVHNGVRKTVPLQEQMDAFLRPDGEIRWFCDAPCDGLELP
ncbi:MAG: hypothetical protein R3A78_08890 [Polyangiales bacterium]